MRAPRGSGKPRAVARPKVIELDLSSGDTPLKPFEQENPDTDSGRYLAIAFGSATARSFVGMNHIYTAYLDGLEMIPQTRRRSVT